MTKDMSTNMVASSDVGLSPMRIDERVQERSRRHSFLSDLTHDTAFATPLRLLASNSDVAEDGSSIYSIRSASIRDSRSIPERYVLTTLVDQRHPGSPKTWLGTIVATPDVSDDEGQPTNVATGSRHGFVSNLDRPQSPRHVGDSSRIMVSSSKANVSASLHDQTVDEVAEPVYPDTLKLSLLLVGICLAVFLISLDRTIVTTAIPSIEADFRSYDDGGWYGSAYLLTASAFQPLYGRVFQIFDLKWSFLAALGMFGLGSLICGISPVSLSLIVGRAIAGVGAAGILTGSFVIMTHAVPAQIRPVYTAAIGMMFGLGAICGPLLGGVFTDTISWRWCFYINLPVGGLTVAAMALFFQSPACQGADRGFLARILSLDLVGNVMLLAASIMLFLALQYTELGHAWSSALIIGLLVGCACMAIVFIAWQGHKGAAALIPAHIVRLRNVSASCGMAFFLYAALIIHSFYLPQWFQAIVGDNAIQSGVHMIPYMVANAIFSLAAGIFVSKVGYFILPAIVGCVIGTAGCGLIAILGPASSVGIWVGFEIIVSAGFGLAIQQGFTAVQTAVTLHDMPIATAAVVACQSLGGALFVSVGNTILQSELFAGQSQVPNVNMTAVINAGAARFRSQVFPEDLPALIEVYNGALQKVFLAAIPMAGLATVCACLMSWRGMRMKPREKQSVEGGAA